MTCTFKHPSNSHTNCGRLSPATLLTSFFTAVDCYSTYVRTLTSDPQFPTTNQEHNLQQLKLSSMPNLELTSLVPKPVPFQRTPSPKRHLLPKAPKKQRTRRLKPSQPIRLIFDPNLSLLLGVDYKYTIELK